VRDRASTIDMADMYNAWVFGGKFIDSPPGGCHAFKGVLRRECHA
jgi:hypothetical protein